MRATATMTTRTGETVISVTVDNASHMNGALAECQRKLNHEFDHCFEADKWQTVVITIERGAT